MVNQSYSCVLQSVLLLCNKNKYLIFTVKEFCKVTFGFEATHEDELSLKEGDIIHILSKVSLQVPRVCVAVNLDD